MTWDRKEMKMRAKASLKGIFLMAGIAALIYMVLAGKNFIDVASTYSSDSINRSIEIGNFKWDFNVGEGMPGVVDKDFNWLLSLPYLWLGSLAGLAGLLISIFVGGPIVVGLSRYFLTVARNKDRADLGVLFSVFSDGSYMNIVSAVFITNLKIFLWTLLFIIPGIIKSYEYYYVPWILAENPAMKQKEAQELSSRMTFGSKSAMFVTDLSFIGWYMVSAFALGFLDPWVKAYATATFTEIYEVVSVPQTGTQY
jgi:uncharacterized membrane protein